MAPQNHITDTVAGIAITSPFWLTHLENISKVIDYIFPIVGVIWIVIQIIYKFIERAEQKHTLHGRSEESL